MRYLADLAYLLAGGAYLPKALYDAVVVGKNRRGWRQRFGVYPQQDDRPRLWIHGVSLGEINAAPRLVALLRDCLPDHDVVVTSTTDTGYARAVQHFGAERVFRFPLDFSPVIARALNRIRPALIVLVELEVWYNLVRMATGRGIPVVVVNGRLTERSAHRFSLLGAPVRRMFADLAWVGAQDDTIADRFERLGVAPERLTVTSSLKWDTAPLDQEVAGAANLARALGIVDGSPTWVCGSTGPGEEAMALAAYQLLLKLWAPVARSVHTENGAGGDSPGKPPRLVIVPRKPERFDEVARLVERSGWRCVRRSVHEDGAPPPPSLEGAVILGDTLGELRKFYALADVVFVGRTLVPLGGSDPMEVAALAKPMISGPHTANFETPVRAFRNAGVLRVVEDVESLATTVGGLLADRAQARELGQRAREVVRVHQGATLRTVECLVQLRRSMTGRGQQLRPPGHFAHSEAGQVTPTQEQS